VANGRILINVIMLPISKKVFRFAPPRTLEIKVSLNFFPYPPTSVMVLASLKVRVPELGLHMIFESRADCREVSPVGSVGGQDGGRVKSSATTLKQGDGGDEASASNRLAQERSRRRLSIDGRERRRSSSSNKKKKRRVGEEKRGVEEDDVAGGREKMIKGREKGNVEI
jgi:hypothetical protein